MLKKYDKALADSSVVIKYGIRNWYPYFLRGECYFMLEEYDKALHDFSDAIKLNPSRWELYNERAKTYKKLGRPAESAEDLLRTRQLSGNTS
jgi:tetratricopeptide (TPR) repeat protein